MLTLCIYITCLVSQSPPGVKQNLMRTYDTWTPEYIAKGGNVVRAQALFALAWLHAVMQERRMYIPQVGFGGSLSLPFEGPLSKWM